MIAAAREVTDEGYEAIGLSVDRTDAASVAFPCKKRLVFRAVKMWLIEVITRQTPLLKHSLVHYDDHARRLISAEGMDACGSANLGGHLVS